MDEEFYDRHCPAIIRFFRGWVSDDVEDLVQETFVRMIDGHTRVSDPGNLRSYLFGIAWNVLKEHLRKKKRVRDRQIDLNVDSAEDLGLGLSTLMARRREHRVLLEALRRVPIQHQAALQLHYWDGLKTADIAQIMGVSASAMRDRMCKARALLEQQLEIVEQTMPLTPSSSTST